LELSRYCAGPCHLGSTRPYRKLCPHSGIGVHEIHHYCWKGNPKQPRKMEDNTTENGTEEEAPFPLTDVDRWVLSQTDEEFHLHDWDELKVIIGMLEFTSTCVFTSWIGAKLDVLKS
jgi:hypothetical protein